MSLLLVIAILSGSWLMRRWFWTLGWFARFWRLPGNLLHELAHAVSTLVCGYTVVGFHVAWTDPEGRGGVRPGPAWAPWARPWLANLVSPVAPLGAGLGALVALGRWGQVDPWPVSWQGAAAIALAVSVATEMTPSDVDLRAWRWPALALALVLGGLAWWLEETQPGLLVAGVAPLDRRGADWLIEAAAMVGWGLAAVGLARGALAVTGR